MSDRVPFYIWLLPVLGGTCSYIHHNFPGDENAMWLLGSAPGLWIAPFVFLSSSAKESAPVLIAFALSVVLFVVGLLMDRFCIHKVLWAATFVVCVVAIFAASLLSFPSIDRAISKNGSISCYICFSFNIGLYLSAILSSVLTACIKGWSLIHSQKTG